MVTCDTIRNKEEDQLSRRDFNYGSYAEVMFSEPELAKPLLRMLLACVHLECDEVKRINKLGDN